MRRGFKKTYTGLEITRTCVNTVKVGYGSAGWNLIRTKSIKFPEEIIKFSYRNNNIIKPDLLSEIVRDAVDFHGRDKMAVGLALPNEIIKVSIQEFGELPELESEIERMVSWTIERTFHFPANTTRSSYHRIGWSEGFEKLLVSAGSIDVIREYESILKKSGLNPEVVKPSGVSQFNFYSQKLSDKGVISFIGLFEKFFTFYVFKNSKLIFYQGIKKGAGSEHYLDEMSMCFEYYQSQNPDDEIEKLYIGGYTGQREDAESIFSAFGYMDIIVIDETRIIGKGKDLDFSGKDGEITPFASAIGAAQGLLFN